MGGVVEGYFNAMVPAELFDEQLVYSNSRRVRKGKGSEKRSYNKTNKIKQL